MLELVAYDKTGAFLQILTPLSAHVDLLWNKVSFAELVFRDDDRALQALAAGSRVAAFWDAVQVMRGPVVKWDGAGPVGEVTVTVEDDFRVFRNLGWPKPDALITAQTDEFKRYEGPTETVIKDAVADLATVLGESWTVGASAGLGSTQRVEVRFDPLVDTLGPLADADLLTWAISDGVVTVTEGELFPRELTVESGVLGSYKWSLSAPTVTRAVVGGEGDGASRVLREYTDSAREATWGFKSAKFVDSKLAEGVTDLSPDAAVAFAEGSGGASVSSELVENSWFRFGKYKVGDRVHVVVGPVDTTEVIRRVTIDASPADGEVVVPFIGDVSGSDDTFLAGQVAMLARGVRAQGRR